jgi:hypothetical protein
MHPRVRLPARQRFACLSFSAQHYTYPDARLLAAFKPLYANLSSEQQQMANQLVDAHHHWHHRA